MKKKTYILFPYAGNYVWAYILTQAYTDGIDGKEKNNSTSHHTHE